MTTVDGSNRRKVSTREALRQLAEKPVSSPYRAPRGNQDRDRAATDNSVDRLHVVLGH
jgi:hypothetical protein